MESETLFAHAFNTSTLLNPLHLRALKEYFGSFARAWEAPPHEIEQALKNKQKAEDVHRNRKTLSPEKLWKELAAEHITALLSDTPAYPERLRVIPAPPQILYVKGMLPAEESPAIAVVGTRHPTTYGRDMCGHIVRDLSRAGVSIVSGLAIGMDACAHKTALEANGHTIAVVGSGLHSSVLYPASNRRLADTILASGGAIMSEYPLHMRAAAWTFPQRNRIIAGISDATLVIEAKKKSGTRITANYALEYSRDVFAVPGPVYSSYSETPHMLIKDGAGLITSANDILSTLPGYSEVGLPNMSPDTSADLSTEELSILSLLSEPQTINTLSRTANMPASLVSRLISRLEIDGRVKQSGVGMYRKV
jgi:DNA processing protein